MSERASLEAVAVCPRCGSPLARDEGAFTCGAHHFPDLGPVPCLLSDPGLARRVWGAQLEMVHREADASLATFEAELRRPALLASTRARLQAQKELVIRARAEIDGLLAPLGIVRGAGHEPSGYRPLSILHTAHRDWSWPASDENARAAEMVAKVIDGRGVGRMLVAGAGACRLAYDVHRAHGAELTVAIDLDPLSMWIAHRVVRGERVPLVETRANASELDRLSAERVLEAPGGPVDHLHAVIADALAPPFAPGAFDTLLTPWFLDVGPQDLRDFVGVADRMLAPGGRWVHFGPLLYPTERAAACRYSRQEIFDLAELAGFEIERSTAAVLEYGRSPLTERGRLEPCLAFAARKVGQPRSREGDPPAWMVLPHLPVPDFASRGLLHPTSASARAILELIDGRRGVDAIAREMIARSGTTAGLAAVKDSVRLCLADLHPGARGA